jgi:hypothetical protein
MYVHNVVGQGAADVMALHRINRDEVGVSCAVGGSFARRPDINILS